MIKHFITIIFVCISIFAFAQTKTADNDAATTTAPASKENNRNVMLNAASANTGPREVNIGLPASVGGTTVLENNLPSVYFFWPEMPYRSWRTDAMTVGVKLLDLGATAINIGDVGFSVGSYDNLGTDLTQGRLYLNSNSFGLLNGSFALSGSMTKGLKFAVGGYANYDPGTFKTTVTDRYYNDQMLLFKAALTKDYKLGNSGNGSISLMYKLSEATGISNFAAPYIYSDKGKVKEINGFRIGQDSYIATQEIFLKDAFTGKHRKQNALKDYGTSSHTLDIIGKNTFDNGLNFNYIVRLHTAKSGIYLPIMTGVESASEGDYIYSDDKKEYSGKNVQGVLVLASRKTPLKSITSLFEVGKRSGNHEWKVGLNQWNYNIDKFVTENAIYYQEVAVNPRKLENRKVGATNKYGNIDAGNEYHNGSENKTAIFATDKWDASSWLTLYGGVRFEYLALRGDYIDKGTTPEKAYINTKKTKIDENFFTKSFVLNGVFKLTKSFGLIAEGTYNEQAGHLENYSAGNYPDLKKSKIPGATFGVFFNHPKISIVSKATYIQRDEYRQTVNFTNPDNLSLVSRDIVHFDIQTLGWTTDIVTNPFKNFDLHFLFTYQNPVYKNYQGTVTFADKSIHSYDFNGRVANGISNVLIEIDPSYTWNALKIWLSARYFSKQYANLPNTLYFAGRWETFAGLNYTFNKHFDASVTVVNLLNERGAKGTISGTDLVKKDRAKEKIGTVMSGSYIRPFTVEFGLKYKF
jgi:hypothetical protein